MLQVMSHWLVTSVLGLDPRSRFGAAVDFFIYDSVKILLLLFFLIAVIGFLRSFLPQRKIKEWIGGRGVWGNFLASLFGAVTPFCSCSSIPIFISFLKTGVPLGVTFSFLIASPLINEYLVVLMIGFFGWKITVLYVLSGMTIGIAAGVILGRMNLEGYIEKDMSAAPTDEGPVPDPVFRGLRHRAAYGLDEAWGIVKKLWLWILVGVGLGAVIHNYVPEEFIQSAIRKTGVFSVPIATLIGVPMYGSCAAIVPIAVVLFQKGFPLGTTLSFMMAVAALSLSEAVMLRRAMRVHLIAVFYGITTLGIILTGYLFNSLQKILF